MNSIWEILGIQPTNNKREIRAAYSEKAKQFHPEEEPEAFERLHRAYEQALEYENQQFNYVVNQKNYSQSNHNQDNCNQDIEKKQDIDEKEKIETERIETEQELELLLRLEQEEEKKLEESRRFGALKQLIEIFEDPKKINNAEIWKKFFISEEFLREQNSKEFADGMFQYLSQMHTENNYRMESLPSRFLLEMSISYGLLPNTSDNYFVQASGGFYGRNIAANIWNSQKEEYPYPNRILFKPENIVRLRSFSDYFRLMNMNKNQYLTRNNRNSWEKILMSGCANHLYELKGKGYREIYETTRSTCFITLLTFWLQTEQVPHCVLEYMYKEYSLKTIEHTSTQRIYAPLKQAILKQYPQIEEDMFDENGKVQIMDNWYRALMRIVSDNHSDYDKGLYEESAQIKERVEQLFSCPEWEKIQYEPELFEKMFLQLHNRKVLPKSLAIRLIDFYSQDGPWDNVGRVQLMLEGLYQSLGFIRKMKEIDGMVSVPLEMARVEDIGDDNKEFWYYFLMCGFGFRSASIKGSSNSNQEYAKGSTYYLPPYINEIYYPSLEWQKLFTGFDKKENKICNPVSEEFILPDGKKLKAEFYLHYVLYYLDDELVFQPSYTWEKAMEFAGKIERTDQFFYLLAITRIQPQERKQAKEQIEMRLKNLSLYPPTRSVIATLLAQDNGRDWEEEQEISEYEAEDVREHWMLEDREKVLAVYYMEQEKYCFRLTATKENITLFYQEKFGWTELYERNWEEWGENAALGGEKNWSREALDMMHSLRQPKPVSIGAISLEGMDNEKKAEEILEALKMHMRYKEKKEELCAIVPGEQWSMEDSKELSDFFKKEGRYLTESYCVLRYGEDKRNERVFYCSMEPYGFPVADHNMEFESTYQYNLNNLDKKIKEKYWIVGRFGWGEIYNPKYGFEPKPIAIGKSGTYYADGFIRLRRAQNLSELLSQLFDFSNVMEVESYEGVLSISRLNHSLEYCYSKEDFYKSVYNKEILWADLFTKFTKAEILWEFGLWMDKLLEREDRFHVLYFELMWEKSGRYSLCVYDQTCPCSFEDSSKKHRRELDCGGKQFMWKNTDRDTVLGEVGNLVQWYLSVGKYRDKMINSLMIDIGFSHKKHGTYTGTTLYKNVKGIMDAVMQRNAMQAYSVTIKEDEKPSIFHSKFGGMPYWDGSKEYPKDSQGEKLVLIAQFNLDNNKIEALPDGGMLQFFGKPEEIFSQGFGTWDDQDKYRVVYHERIDYNVCEKELSSMELPDSTRMNYPKHVPISNETQVELTVKTAYLGNEDYRYYQEFSDAIKERFDMNLSENNYYKVLESDERYDLEHKMSNAGSWLLGYSQFARKDPREKEKQFRQYDRLLFQLDVHYLNREQNEYYFKHGGCGVANFFIRNEDLLNRDFSHIMYHWECCKQ